MKKKSASIQKPAGFSSLITEVRSLVHSARHAAATSVNTLQVLTNFEIGRRIVEHEQKGAKRAAYGAELLKVLAARLTEEFGRGFSVTNLKLMRQFFVENQCRMGQKPPDQSLKAAISKKPSGKLALSSKADVSTILSRTSFFPLSCGPTTFFSSPSMTRTNAASTRSRQHPKAGAFQN